MFNSLFKKKLISKNEIAELLKINPNAYAAFEEAYQDHCANSETSDNLFEISAKEAIMKRSNSNEIDPYYETIVQIVMELLADTVGYTFDGDLGKTFQFSSESPIQYIKTEELNKIPEEFRPQLSGTCMKTDIKEDSSIVLMELYRKFQTGKDEITKQRAYHLFRQGLDILDYSPLMYEIIGTNPNSIGHWFPQLVEAAKNVPFFKIPKTTYIKVPMPLLQLTRNDYFSLTPTTIKIVDLFCKLAFQLDNAKDYFIKTGTYSSKFDFRNAHVVKGKEVDELGEYLLYIHYLANMMASPLNTDAQGNAGCIYGVSTTNEWVVREYIKPASSLPEVYHGLKLRNELRCFIDADNKENPLLGVTQYWHPDVMKRHFEKGADAGNPVQYHDYAIYKAYEKILTDQFTATKDIVAEQITELTKHLDLPGQWSIDVMQNGDDFYLIDMASAQESALIEQIDKNRLIRQEENWLPDLSRFS